VSDTRPALANLVRGGDAQTEATAISAGQGTPFIFMARDISNAYLVTTSHGDVMINTGFFDDAHVERNVSLLKPHRTGPLQYIILTQSHADHFGGVPAFKEADTRVVGGPGFNAAWADMNRLQPFFAPRSGKLWGSTLKRGNAPKPVPQVVPDMLVDRRRTLQVGQRIFELIHTPEGETVDGLTVWLPNEKIAFTGNLVGPVWLSMPFLCTLRGDKPRSVRAYLKSLETVRELGAEIVITGHGDPVCGAERIRADIDRMHGAVSWVRDYTLDGMNAGTSMHQLMREIALPEALGIGEFHGKISWAVRTIWEEYAGWFRYEEGTTALYGVPRSNVDADLAELAGGAAELAQRGQLKLAQGKPLEALHLTDIALGAEPQCAGALAVKLGACQLLLAQSGGNNLSETMWLRAEIADAQARLG
jgi:glyoxylase-like metal-dependent hydrolase (beta-lactamase superfamily II)